jgi:hypothetical protein
LTTWFGAENFSFLIRSCAGAQFIDIIQLTIYSAFTQGTAVVWHPRKHKLKCFRELIHLTMEISKSLKM